MTRRQVVSRGLLLFSGWTVFGLLSSAQFFVAGKPVRDMAAFVDLASHILVFYWAWAALTPLVFYVANRVIAGGKALWIQAFILLSFSVLLVFVHGVLYTALLRVFAVDLSAGLNAAGLHAYALRHGGGDLATLGVLIGACYFVDASRRSREREVASSAMAAKLATADLEILRWRLQPHFLFNALNTVSTLVIKADSARAEKAIELISRYLRSVLEQRADTTVPLSDEIAMVDRYVAIERLRFPDAVNVEIQISDDALSSRVPGQIVQPLVENALVHGDAAVQPIRLVGCIESGRLHLTVTNAERDSDRAAARDGNGFGLRYVRERLAHFYGANASLNFSSHGGIATATLDIPA